MSDLGKALVSLFYKEASMPNAAELWHAIKNPSGELGAPLYETAGLGVLAAPVADSLQARIRAQLAGEQGDEAVEKRMLVPGTAHDVAELSGLGILAAPGIQHMLGKKVHGG